MPLFEYDCKGCGHRFEALVLGSERPECPACKSDDLETVFSSFAVSHGGNSGGEGRRPSGAGCGISSGGG